MRPPPRFITRFALAICAMVLPILSGAQEMKTQETPFSVWLDFKLLEKAADGSKVKLPVWLRSIQSEPTIGVNGVVLKTTFRLQFRRFDELQRDLLLRLFYDDLKDDLLSVTGWTETGIQRFARGPIGSGLNLPASESLILPMDGVNYLDVIAAGDGSAVRGVYLSWLRKTEVRHPLDFARPPEVADPFDNLPSHLPPVDDLFLAGRVKATIDPGQAKLTPREAPTGRWEFELAVPPFVGAVSFEVLNADPLAPLEVVVNDLPIGIAAVRLPDLADPGYRGVIRPLDRGVQFRYGGWLPAQLAIPGSALHAGLNTVVLKLPAASGAVAVRSLELQLKNQWQNLNQTVTPATP